MKKAFLNIALLFMIAELSYINSKSLFHLSGSNEIIHQAFAIIGAIAFSIVTILVMQEPGMKWQKVIFPFFDAALVFLGFNLNLHPDMRIYLTIFMAVFAGMIMYSLGKIENKGGVSEDAKQLAHQTKRANSLGKQLDELKSTTIDITNKLHDINKLHHQKKQDIESLTTDLQKAQSDIELMRPIYLKSELSRIRKKSEINRTHAEVEMLEECA